jgi:hypothetical protein
MKRLLVLAALTPVVALASSAFDGTWKADLHTFKVTGKPDVYELSGGMYACNSCAPAYKVKADGTDQPVPDIGFEDHVAVSIVDKSTVDITFKKAGKTLAKNVLTVSPDGSMVTGKFTSYYGEKPVMGTMTEKRVAAGPSGSHALSGSWLADSISDYSDVGRLMMLQSTDNGIRISWNGQTVDAKFDGKKHAWSNDPASTMSIFKKLSDTQIEELDYRKDKVTDDTIFTVAADGKSVTVVDTDKVRENKTSYTMDKQP